MEFVCDAPGNLTWFRIVTEGEAAAESRDLRHAVEKYFHREWDRAEAGYQPPTTVFIEQAIGLADHIRRAMPLFLTLRDMDGTGLATAMLPPGGKPDRGFSPIIVGPANADPYVTHAEAILALTEHFAIPLDRARCYPYRR
ncbi:MAG: hypothetical protein ACREFY_17075 [Acetobacteraceae bacterium]